MLNKKRFHIFLLVFCFFIKNVEGKTFLHIHRMALNETLEIPNSSVKGFNNITICGRIFSHQFASKAQKIFQIETEIGSFGFGTTPGFNCDDTEYKGR